MLPAGRDPKWLPRNVEQAGVHPVGGAAAAKLKASCNCTKSHKCFLGFSFSRQFRKMWTQIFVDMVKGTVVLSLQKAKL